MRRLQLFLVLMTLSLAGCALNGGPARYAVDTKVAYPLDTDDIIRVTVYGEAELTQTYKVEDGGTVSLPLAGQVHVRGLTTQMAAASITSALSDGYIREPSVAVEIAQYRPFFIQGAINGAGQFPYVYGMTVRAAISTAGGYTDTADRSRATLYRRKGTAMVKGIVSLDFPIYPGDTIVISERWF